MQTGPPPWEPQPAGLAERLAPFDLPPAGAYGAGLVFLPTADAPRAALRALIERIVREGVLRGAQWRRGAWHDLVAYSRLRTDEPAGPGDG